MTSTHRHRGSRGQVRTVVITVWSVVVWVALWGDLSVANVLWGAVVGLLTLWILPTGVRRHRVPVRVVPVLRFAAAATWLLVKASAVVAWEVVTPINDINEGIVAIPLRTTAPGPITVLANTISLTPGTLTLEVRREPPTLYVHVLHLRDIEDVRADIHWLEDIVLQAFGDRPEDAPAEEAAP